MKKCLCRLAEALDFEKKKSLSFDKDFGADEGT